MANTLALSLGQVGARALSIVYIAALARHVHAEGMGQLATAQSLTAILALFIGLGHDTLAVREIAATPAKASLWLSNLLALRGVLSVAGLGVLLVFSAAVGYSRATTEVILVYGLVMVVYSLLSTARDVTQAHERLVLLALTQFGRDVANIGLSLLAIALGASLVTIVWISVLVNLGQLVVELAILRRLRLARWVVPSLAACQAILRSGVGIGVIVVCSVLYAQSGLILLSLLSDSAATGAYSAAFNLLLVLLILPDMFNRAVLPVFARQYAAEHEALGSTYQRSLKALTMIGLPLAVGTAVVAEPLINLLYGPGFQAAVVPLRVLALAVAVTGSYASGAVLIATGRQRAFAASYILEVASLVVLGVVLIPAWGIVGATVAYTLPRVVAFVWYSGLCHRLLRLRLPVETFARSAFAAACMGWVVWSALQMGVHFLWLVGLVGPLVYAGVLVLVGGIDVRQWRRLRQVVLAG
jgi:O-antigen/teichoic acid export membrane protein